MSNTQHEIDTRESLIKRKLATYDRLGAEIKQLSLELNALKRVRASEQKHGKPEPKPLVVLTLPPIRFYPEKVS